MSSRSKRVKGRLIDEVEEYRRAYCDFHGKPPDITHRGSWLAIGQGAFSHKVRRSDLPAMTGRLRWLKMKRDENTHGSKQ